MKKNSFVLCNFLRASNRLINALQRNGGLRVRLTKKEKKERDKKREEPCEGSKGTKTGKQKNLRKEGQKREREEQKIAYQTSFMNVSSAITSIILFHLTLVTIHKHLALLLPLFCYFVFYQLSMLTFIRLLIYTLHVIIVVNRVGLLFGTY